MMNKVNQTLILGKQRAIVETVEQFKCQIRLVGLWNNVPTEDLPWAEYQFSVGARANEGNFEQCKVGDYVFVEFLAGDSRYPIITGACYFAPEEVPNMPHELFGGEQAHSHQRTDNQPTPSAPHQSDKISSLNGFMIELTHEGAYRATHKTTGTAFEITKDGEIVLFGANDLFQSAGGRFKGEVIGMFEQDVGDNYTLNVGGSKTETIESNLKIVVKGNASFEVDGTFNVDKASAINLLQGAGVVTGAHICSYTGSPHTDCSSKVKAIK